MDPPAHLGLPGDAGLLPRRRLRQRAVLAFGPRQAGAVRRVAACAPASPPRSGRAAPARLAGRRFRGVRGRGAGRDAAHGIPGGARAHLVPRCLRRRVRHRARHAVAVGAPRVGQHRRRAAPGVPRRPREHRRGHPRGRVRELRRRVGHGPPARLRLARRPAGGDGAEVGPRGRRPRRRRGPGVGRPVPRVDDRARRGRGEQLVPDPGDARLPRAAPGRAGARARAAGWRPGCSDPARGRRPCCSTPAS